MLRIVTETGIRNNPISSDSTAEKNLMLDAHFAFCTLQERMV